MDGDTVGTRLRRWRIRRGLTQRTLADLAGFSQGYVAQIEAGLAPLERRAPREALARALQISVDELTGHPDPAAPHQPVDRQAMALLRAGIAAVSFPDVAAPGGDPAPGRVDSAWLDRLFDECRYDVLVPALGGALTALAVRSRTVTDDERLDHLRQLVEVCSITVSACVQLGHQDLTLSVAETAMRTARELGDPATLGLANYARIRALTGTEGAGRAVAEGIDRLSPHIGVDLDAASVYGMHHLVSAILAAEAGHGATAMGHLDEAARAAGLTGERPRDWFGFGPTNVGIWRVAVLVVLGDGPAVRAPVPGFRVEALPVAHRQATYFIDLSRALLQCRGADSAAAAALHRAEVIAPQLVGTSEGAREAVGTLLRRPRFGRDARLRGFARRVGLPD
ncbi:MAG TPA: helix-turn-helix transcriptional regulator [Catenuloplanes sp.]|jgi:transcriptional regulator with XRE-family HTH domain